MAALTGLFLEDLSVGMAATMTKEIGEEDVVSFARLSGDVNPVHLDEDYARSTRFGIRIAHGMLTASLFSAVIGTRLPGPGAIYLSQNLRFRAPVRLGQSVAATCMVKEIDAKRRRVHLACEARVEDTVVIEGEALVLAPSRAEAGS